jgi:predicted phosphodiesterase
LTSLDFVLVIPADLQLFRADCRQIEMGGWRQAMRLQIASDLHLEHQNCYATRHGPLCYAPSDVLVLAGDIDRIDKVCDRFADWPCPVLYVRGNHDSFFTSYEHGISHAVELSKDGRFKLLERNVVAFNGVRVLGCCLWTDFALLGRIEDALLLAKYSSADYRCLRRADGALLSPEDIQFEHRLTAAWLERELQVPFGGITVVVTHHAPHIRSLDARYGRNRFDASFASDLSVLTKKVNLWIHGHVHNSCDYRLNRCRVVCNPAGHPTRPNPHFNPRLVVDI